MKRSSLRAALEGTYGATDGEYSWNNRVRRVVFVPVETIDLEVRKNPDDMTNSELLAMAKEE